MRGRMPIAIIVLRSNRKMDCLRTVGGMHGARPTARHAGRAGSRGAELDRSSSTVLRARPVFARPAAGLRKHHGLFRDTL